MTADPQFYHGQARTAISEIAISFDATGNGIEVLPAVAGATLYLLGAAMFNHTQGAITFTPTAGAGAVGAVAIGIPIEVQALTTRGIEFEVPLAADAVNRNIGIVTSGVAKLAMEMWGYYAT